MPYFINKKNERIRYKSIKGKGPGIIFIHGLNSDMSGQKALSLERFARKNKLQFIRFECRGHGNLMENSKILQFQIGRKI